MLEELRAERLDRGKALTEMGRRLETLEHEVGERIDKPDDGSSLLQQVADPKVIAQDTDAVSAMLTAIEDFVKDSFSGAVEGKVSRKQRRPARLGKGKLAGCLASVLTQL